MSNVPDDLKYTDRHEWVRLEDGTATIGVTDFAQNALGEVSYVELPEPGWKVAQGKEFAVVESLKAASDVYAPVSGTVAAVNGSTPTRTARGGCARSRASTRRNSPRCSRPSNTRN